MSLKKKILKYLALSIIGIILLFIHPILLLIYALIILGIFLIPKFMRNRIKVEKREIKIVRKVEDFDKIELNHIILEYGIGKVLTKIGRYWISIVEVELLNQDIENDILKIEKCSILKTMDKNFIIIKDEDFTNLINIVNSLATIFQIKGLRFNILNPSKCIETVFQICGIV